VALIARQVQLDNLQLFWDAQYRFAMLGGVAESQPTHRLRFSIVPSENLHGNSNEL
jgi:hypothetical protein